MVAVLQVLQLLTSLQERAQSVTIFEKEEKAGGVIRYVIPGFRIGDAAIDKDISFSPEDGCRDPHKYRNHFCGRSESTGL